MRTNMAVIVERHVEGHGKSINNLCRWRRWSTSLTQTRHKLRDLDVRSGFGVCCSFQMMEIRDGTSVQDNAADAGKCVPKWR